MARKMAWSRRICACLILIGAINARAPAPTWKHAEENVLEQEDEKINSNRKLFYRRVAASTGNSITVVYELDQMAGIWKEIFGFTGDEIRASHNLWDVSISNDGSKVSGHFAPGSVDSYGEDMNGNWTARGGSPLPGNRVALSDDGSRMVIGDDIAKLVSLYEFDGGEWDPLGDSLVLDGSTNASVAISGDGGTLAVGAYNLGSVQVFEYDSIEKSLFQLGNPMFGDVFFGQAVSLINNGTRIAIGAGLYVSIYDYRDNTWTQSATIQASPSDNGSFGSSVSISTNGDRLIIGSVRYNNGTGRSIVYEWNSRGIWSQIGQDIVGTNENDFEGFAVSISSGGQYVASSAPLAQDIMTQTFGSIRVFRVVGEYGP